MTAKRCTIPAAVLLVVWAGAAPAQTGDLRTEMMHCLTFTGAVERLSCYDRLAHGAASGALGQPAAPVPVSPPPRVAVAPPPPSVRELGEEELRGRATATAVPDRLTVEISTFQKDPAGRFIVSLANGQVWQQVAGDTTAAQYHPGRTHSVTISRGTLGSYDLTFNDRSIAFKVRRVR